MDLVSHFSDTAFLANIVTVAVHGHETVYGGDEGLRHHLCLHHDEHFEPGELSRDELEERHEDEHGYSPAHRGEYGCPDHHEENEPTEFSDMREAHGEIGDIHRGIGVDLPDDLHRFVHDRRRRVSDRAQALLDHVSDHPGHWGTHWTTEERVAEDFGEKSARGYATGRKPGTSVVFHAASPDIEDIDRDPNRWGNGDVYGYSAHGEREVPIRNSSGLDLKRISWAPVYDDWDTPGDREYVHHDFAHEPREAAQSQHPSGRDWFYGEQPAHTADLPDEMHRGIPVWLPPEVHSAVHDESRPAGERARLIMQHLDQRAARDARYGEGGLGIHWSVTERAARGFATKYDVTNHSPYDFVHDPAATQVVFHARTAEPSQMLRGKKSLDEHEIFGVNHGEGEIPLKKRSRVALTGISWSRNEKDAPLTRHTFPQPLARSAGTYVAPAEGEGESAYMPHEAVLGHFEAATQPVPWYHGTRDQYAPGDKVEHHYWKKYPDRQDFRENSPLYLTTDPSLAAHIADLRGGAEGHLYEVRPVGDLHPDELANPVIRGNASWRTTSPLHVVREVPREEWPQDLMAWKRPDEEIDEDRRSGEAYRHEASRPDDYVLLPDGSALVEGMDCPVCGHHVTKYRGAWWNDDDSPHDCDDFTGQGEGLLGHFEAAAGPEPNAEYFHGSRYQLYVGDRLTPEDAPSSNSSVKRDYVFACTSPEDAASYAVSARGPHKPTVYRVRPRGPVEPDPDPDRGVDAWQGKEWEVVSVHDKATQLARKTDRLRRRTGGVTGGRPNRGEKQCPCCHGQGTHGSDPCQACGGEGSVGRSETVEHCPGQPQPRRRHWREASMPEPDYEPAAELPVGRGVWYRAHIAGQPLDEAHARSRPLNRPWPGSPGADHPAASNVGLNGYSAFAHPRHLHDYMEEYGWAGEPEVDWDNREVVAFHGRQVGRGADNEPLVHPEASPHCCGNVIHSRMPWEEFEQKLPGTEPLHPSAVPPWKTLYAPDPTPRSKSVQRHYKDETDRINREKRRQRHQERQGRQVTAMAEDGDVYMTPPGKSPVAEHAERLMDAGEYHPHPFLSAPDYGPYHVIRDPAREHGASAAHRERNATYHVVDRNGLSVHPFGLAHDGSRGMSSGWHGAMDDWHRLTHREEPDDFRHGENRNPSHVDAVAMSERYRAHVQAHPPQFPHSRVSPYDMAVAMRPEAREGAPEGHSPPEEWHGPYEVVRHPETGRYHVVDNAGRQANSGMTAIRGFEDQPSAEKSRDYIDARRQSYEVGKGLGEAMFGGAMNALDPGGTEESRESDRHLNDAQGLMTRYEGGRGQVKFEDDEHGGRPYYELEHHDEHGRPTGWHARHYGGPNIDIYHRATGEEAHDTRSLPTDDIEGGLLPGYGERDLDSDLREWHGEEGGTREHLEGPYGDPRIARWKRRHLGALEAPAAGVVAHFEEPAGEGHRMSHRPLPDGAPAHDLHEAYSEDIYTHPQWWAGRWPDKASAEGLAQLRAARGNPDHPVTVYRASPPGAPYRMTEGDWVSLSPSYAISHLESMSHPQGWFVHKAVVPARDVRDAGTDQYREQGYWGPDVASEHHWPPRRQVQAEAAPRPSFEFRDEWRGTHGGAVRWPYGTYIPRETYGTWHAHDAATGEHLGHLDYDIVERHMGDQVHVQDLKTDPGKEGRGVASALMDHLYAQHPEPQRVTHSMRTDEGAGWWDKYIARRPEIAAREERQDAAEDDDGEDDDEEPRGVVAHFDAQAAGRRWYHGTRHVFEDGQLLQGGIHASNQGYGQPGEHVYYSGRPSIAASFAQAAYGPEESDYDDPPRVYQVEPDETHERDPDEIDEADSWRARSARVLREVPWQPHWGRQASVEVTAMSEEPLDLYRGLHLGYGTQEDADELHRDPAAALQTGHGLGIHWTRSPDSAWNFAHDRDPEGWAHEAPDDDGEGGSHSLGLVLHARVHPRHIVQPGTPEWEDYSGFNAILDSGHAEQETTVREGAPVHLHRIWATTVDPEGNPRETEHQADRDVPGSSAGEGREVVAHFEQPARGKPQQLKLFHVQPDPALHAPDSGRHNPADPHAHTRWRAANDEEYEPDECPQCGTDRRLPEEHAEEHENWLRDQQWHTDWDEADVGRTLHRGVTLHLPQHLHDLVHDESRPVSERGEALLSHVTGGYGEEGMGHFWTDAPDVAKNYAESSRPRRRDGDSWQQTPVMLHVANPGREHYETDPEQLEHWGVFSYHLPDNREVPLQHHTPLSITGISWARPDHQQGRHSGIERSFEADPGWTHHQMARPAQTVTSGGRGAITAAVVAHFSEPANPPCRYCGEPLDDSDVADGASSHDECSDIRWCYAHDEHHDDPAEAEDHNETYTDWGQHLPFKGGIHRGITVRLPAGTHSVVHDESLPPEQRAGALAGHLEGEPLGLHWTDHEPTARAWGSGEGAMFGPSEAQRSDPSWTHVVMHAASPDEEDIETRPAILSGRNMLGYDHRRSEREIPIREGAPVTLTGLSWKRADQDEWNRHDFAGHGGHTAALEVTAMDDDDEFEDPDEYPEDDEDDEERRREEEARDRARDEEVARRRASLPYVPPPPEGELIDHVHHMHGLDARTTDLYHSPRGRERWHAAEHASRTWLTGLRHGEAPHQHDHPQGTPGERQWPDAFQLSEHTDFTGGTRGVPGKFDRVLSDPEASRPFAPLMPSESSFRPREAAAEPVVAHFEAAAPEGEDLWRHLQEAHGVGQSGSARMPGEGFMTGLHDRFHRGQVASPRAIQHQHDDLRATQPEGPSNAELVSRMFSPVPPEELEAQRKAREPRPERADDREYSVRDVSRHYDWEGFDPHEIAHLVHDPARATFTREDIPVHTLRHVDEHGQLVAPPSYHDIASQDEDERHRLEELERGYDEGDHVPSIVAVRDGEHHIIADGSHRAAVAANRGWSHIPAFVTQRTIHPPQRTAALEITAAGDDGLDWHEIADRHPALYGDPEVHGEEASPDGNNIADAAAHLYYDRPEQPYEETYGGLHPVYGGGDMRFHPRTVDPSQVDYARHERWDGRVQEAYRGFKGADGGAGVPPVILVHRHGVYQVADGHHRAQGAHMAGRPLRAYVAYSPHEEPFSDGDRGPFHGAEEHPAEAVPDQNGVRRRISYTGFPHAAEAPPPQHHTAAIEPGGDVVRHFAAAGFMSGEEHDPIPPWEGGRPLFHGTRSVLHPGEVLTPGEAERHPAHPLDDSRGYVHVTPEGDEAQYWAEHASPYTTHDRMTELGRERHPRPDAGENQGHAYPPRVYEVELTGNAEPDPWGEGSSYRTSAPVRIKRQVEQLECHGCPDGDGERTLLHWPDHPHWQFLRDQQDEDDEDRWGEHEGSREEGYDPQDEEHGESNEEWEDDPSQYATCDRGHRHYGPYGAAGLLVRHRGGDGGTRYLLQQRSPHVQHGRTWSTPGGAMARGEAPEDAAVREATEELGELPRGLVHHHTYTDDHGGWAYHTVVMDAPREFSPPGGDHRWENSGHGWFTPDEMRELPLHPGFAASWDGVRKSGALEDGPDSRALREERGDRWHEFGNRYSHDLHRGIIADLPDDLHEYVHDESVPREDRARALQQHFAGDGLGLHWTGRLDAARRAILNAASGDESGNGAWRYEHPWEMGRSGHDEYDEDEGEGSPRTAVMFHISRPGDRNRLRNPRQLEDYAVGHGVAEDEFPLKPGSPVRMTGISWKMHDRSGTDPYEHVDFPKPVRHVASRVAAPPKGQLVIASGVSDQVALPAAPARPSPLPVASWAPETAEEAGQLLRDVPVLFRAMHEGLQALARRLDECPVTPDIPDLIRRMAAACLDAEQESSRLVPPGDGDPPEGTCEGPRELEPPKD